MIVFLALTVKEQADVNEAIDTINFLNGVLRKFGLFVTKKIIN